MMPKNFARRMRLLSTFKIAARALRRNKLRSALTALGIIIGVGAVIAMVSIGNGAKAQVEVIGGFPVDAREPVLISRRDLRG